MIKLPNSPPNPHAQRYVAKFPESAISFINGAKYVYNPKLEILAKKVLTNVKVTFLLSNIFSRSAKASGGTVSILGKYMDKPIIAITPINTKNQMDACQFKRLDIYNPKGTPSTVPMLMPPRVNPIALPFFSERTSCEEAEMANGENNPAPAPAIALDINRIVKVGASAVILFAIVKMSIEYNNIFLNGFPARSEANTGADIA